MSTPATGWQPELDELRLREAHAKAMGGPDKVARQHAGGRLTVRERVEALVGKKVGVVDITVVALPLPEAPGRVVR